MDKTEKEKKLIVLKEKRDKNINELKALSELVRIPQKSKIYCCSCQFLEL
jgi:hypothetical protein